MPCRVVPITSLIFSSTEGRNITVGSLRYTARDVQESSVITLDDVGIMMFTCLIFGRGEQSRKFAQLEEMAMMKPDEDLRVLRDEILTLDGKEPQLEVTQQNVKSGAVEGAIRINYYVLTPAAQITDLDGNVIKKIRSLSILPLQPEQVNTLQNQGYDVMRTDGTFTLDQFIASFDDPIKMNGQFVNNKPVTILSGGGESQENLGVFTESLFPSDSETDSRFLGDPQIPLNSDKEAETNFIPTIRLGASGVDPNSSNIFTVGNEDGAPQTKTGIIIPLGLLFLLSGGA